MKRTIAIIAALQAAFLLGGCIADPELKLPVEYTPQTRADGWEISTPAREGIDQDGLAAAYREFFSSDRYHTAISLLVVRNGRLIAEGYCRDRGDVDVARNIKSCTKSVTSLLTGIALDQGLISGLDRKVYDYIPEYFDGDPAKRAITLADALTMRTGLDYGDDDTRDMVINEPESTLRYILARPLSFAPGTRFHYSDGNPQLISGVLERAAGMPLQEFARRELFAPLGITDYVWEKSKDGLTYGPFGLYLKPRDMAKIGQLCLRRGMWNDRRIVSAAWIDSSTTARTNQDSGPYGYYWWVRPEFGAYTAIGHGGNFIYVIPGKNIVIVFTALPNTHGIEIQAPDFEDLVQMIVSAAR
jgi:CubicO group peptidase (beta-lactamase class C family)